jgi:iron only hydrogenase large subunit-like protein
MDRLYPIFTEKAACQDCYKCVRNCPVKAIKVENDHALIVHESCVFCGTCVLSCPVGAKKVRDDVPKVKRLLQIREKVIVSLAPSFVPEFAPATPDQVAASLRALGFWAVSETAIGADLLNAHIAEALSLPDAQGIYISSACPAAVDLVRKYHPNLASRIVGAYSPAFAHASYLKKLYGPDVGVVFIGPCIAKKGEADAHEELVDAALGFKELAAWFEEMGILPERMHVPDPASGATLFVPRKAGRGSIYPVEGGMISSLRRHRIEKSVSFMSFTGLPAISRAIADLESAPMNEPVFLELLACEGGCINGPEMSSGRGTVAKRLEVMDYARLSEAEPFSDPTLPIAEGVGAEPISESPVSEENLRFALSTVGKFSREDELNCSGCGYDSCRDFARAMLRGRAEKTMCVSHMRKLAQKKTNALIRSMPSGVVIVDKSLTIVECNRQFAELAGADALVAWEAKPGLEGASLAKVMPVLEEIFEAVNVNGLEIDRDLRLGKKVVNISAFAVEQGAFTGAVVQDITLPSVRKQRIVSQASKVIDKNLAVVQKIAYLLGENAAETESILNSIIGSFSSGEDDETRK